LSDQQDRARKFFSPDGLIHQPIGGLHLLEVE